MCGDTVGLKVHLKVLLEAMLDSTIEIITGREGRRRWGVEEKLRIVAETHEPGATVGAVAARHDVYPSLLRTWRRQVRDGHLAAAQAQRFVPVRLTNPPLQAAATAPPVDYPSSTDTIEIVLPDGSRVRVGSGVNLAAPRRDRTARMIALPSNVRVWLACGHIDIRRGFDGLASQVQQASWT